MCFVKPLTIAGLIGGPGGADDVDDSDIVRFVPTSLGVNTAGTFEFYFDGSDMDLTTNAERLDGISIAPDGRLVLSTRGRTNSSGFVAKDEDLFLFDPTSLGDVTSGSLELLFDGSDVGMTTGGDDLNAVFYDTVSGELLLSTTGTSAVTGGADEDLSTFTPTSLGSSTAGSFAAFLDGSAVGIPTNCDIVGVDIQ